MKIQRIVVWVLHARQVSAKMAKAKAKAAKPAAKSGLKKPLTAFLLYCNNKRDKASSSVGLTCVHDCLGHPATTDRALRMRRKCMHGLLWHLPQ